LKATMLILFMLIMAVGVVPTQAAFGGFDAKDGLAAKSSLSSANGADSKRIEDRMEEALSGLESFKSTRVDKKTNLMQPDIKNQNSSLQNSSIQNSSIQNLSINSSALNSSALNSSAAKSDLTEDEKLKSNEADAASPTTLEGNSSVGLNGVSTSSKANFNGYYGMTASRHETGKSNIKSKIALSGAFEVDKTVKFQDQGF
jgi:hypothetical protein